VTSLAALAGSAALPAVVAVRRALGHLDPADYHIEVDIREVAADAVFEIVWTPVTAVVDLMLDWDLLDLEIGVAELAEWLDVEVAVARRALDRLSDYGGVTVDETLAGGVVVRLDLEACPLTSAQRPSPRLA